MNTLTRSAMQRRVHDLPSISLVDLDEAASLQMRVDRKYIVDERQLTSMLDALAIRLSALEIEGQRTFGYESIYFDTPELESYLSAAYRRRDRFKVRTRSYLGGGQTMLEVKTRGQRNMTVKNRQEHWFDNRSLVARESQSFIDASTNRVGLAEQLLPVLTTTYERTTLADLAGRARLTVDQNLCCTDWKNDSVRLDTLRIVESKSAGPPSAADRWLWANGIRPAKISKFGTSLAALNPELPSNKWHRTINRYFDGA